jgi:DNA-binding NtrC family response regulator
MGEPKMCPSRSVALPTVLLVENEAQILKLVYTILKKANFAVLAAATPEEALQIEREFSGTIDLLITAFTTPRISGSDLAEWLKVRRPGLAVMLMSGYPDVRKLAQSCGWYFESKPFVLSTLVETTHAAIARGTSQHGVSTN